MSPAIFRRGASAPQNRPPSSNMGGGGDDSDTHPVAGKFMYRLACATPPAFREPIAEAFLRRAGAPGPAAEHVFQHALGRQLAGPDSRRATVVAKSADNFYARQYRQLLNPEMGVFAATATLAVLSAGRPPRGVLWRRHRPIEMAMAETVEDARPILVLDHQTVAIPVFLPLALDRIDCRRMSRWLEGQGLPPAASRRLISGESLACIEPGVRARRRPAAGAIVAVADAATRSGKLAILALHPFDPDAMGLHLTLFGVEAVPPEVLMRDHALDAHVLAPWVHVAERRKEKLFFLVGGIEEAFTQCSQNLFVKRPAPVERRRANWSREWSPGDPLEQLLGAQFELFQATVSASGLPGVSPRNGDIGQAGFVARQGKQPVVLIPYFTGNGVHGHAAKLWTNPYSSLLIWDDHTTGCVVTLSGPSHVAPHDWVSARFPEAPQKIAGRRHRNGAPADDPEYWFVLRVVDIRLQSETVALNDLDPTRAACSIHAAGPAHHGKKPAYFAADTLVSYDMEWQHKREARGRPRDPSGHYRRCWLADSAAAMEARRAHLASVAADEDCCIRA